MGIRLFLLLMCGCAVAVLGMAMPGGSQLPRSGSQSIASYAAAIFGYSSVCFVIGLWGVFERGAATLGVRYSWQARVVYLAVIYPFVVILLLITVPTVGWFPLEGMVLFIFSNVPVVILMRKILFKPFIELYENGTPMPTSTTNAMSDLMEILGRLIQPSRAIVARLVVIHSGPG